MKHPKHPIKKILSICVTGALLAGLMTPALASYTTYGAVTTPVDLKNDNNRLIHFYDIYGGKTTNRTDLNDEVTFYKDAITSNGFLQDWASIAYNIFKSQSDSYRDHADNGWDKDFGEGHYVDLIYDFQNARSTGGKDCMTSTGLSVANSLKEVQRRAASDLAGLIDRKLTGDDFMGQHSIDALTDTNQTVLYTTVSNVDNYSGLSKYEYNSFSIAFYDFQLHVLSDENTLPGKVTTNTSTSEDGLVTLTENYGMSDISGAASLENSVTESLSSTISHSESYTFGQSIGYDVSVTGKIPEVLDVSIGLNLNLSYGQAMETAYSENDTYSETINKSYTVTKPIPAHTVEMGNQTLANTTVTTVYDCPVGLTYKVAIFSMCGACYDDNIGIQSFAGYSRHSFVTLFGGSSDASDAVESLYQRATNHKNDTSYDKTYGCVKGTDEDDDVWCNGLNWNTIIDYGAPKSASATDLKGGTTLIYALDDTYPMSLSGGSTTITQQSITTTEGTAKPIYPIAKVYIPWQGLEDLSLDRSFTLTVGEEHPIHSYRVKASDKDSVPYYGFVAASGTWKIVNEAGKETTSNVAEMVYDKVTGEQTLVAKAAGTTYVKYFIPENTYYTYDGQVSTNDSITSAAYKVIVTDVPTEAFTGTIKVEGSVSATVGETVNLNSELTATAYDSSGKEADVQISWEAQELESKGISVSEDGTLTATKAGTFHVRAYVDDVYSDWVEVTIEEAQEDDVTICYHTYTDVSHDKWYDEAVEFVFQNQLMNGTGDNLFTPNGEVNRAMVAQVLYNAAGSPFLSGETQFTDVPDGSWYAKAVAWAAENGITTGRSDTSFAPLAKVTREELAAFLVRYQNLGDMDLYPVPGDPVTPPTPSLPDSTPTLSDFSDASQVSAWAREAVSTALESGILSGRANGTLDPKGTATRAELAQMLMNLLAERTENA